MLRTLTIPGESERCAGVVEPDSAIPSYEALATPATAAEMRRLWT